MKKILKAVVAFTILICFVPAISVIIKKGTEKVRISREKERFDNRGNLTYFEYDEGSYSGGYYIYSISRLPNKDKVIFKAEGMNGVDLDIEEERDSDILDKIEHIIEDYDLYLWNGFHEFDKGVYDGYGFGLYAKYENYSIDADGYMIFPDDFGNISGEIFNLLLSETKD